ncbi:MAG: NAD(P)H-dependent oxidoreductase [Saprospiraceae bacterium]|nr:NAD(P)H-dependent oxidoreductase [Saprospiraceae bacterium]
MKKGVIILGSSNSNGETFTVSKYLSDKTSYQIIDLKSKFIQPFDYEFNNSNDDFLPLINEIVNNYEIIIFATPVYWYTMSGTMKIFFDRISDCLKTEKETGRKLKGKEMAVLSWGSDKELKNGFYMPFIESANYLGMKYVGEVHCWLKDNDIPEDVEHQLNTFATVVLEIDKKHMKSKDPLYARFLVQFTRPFPDFDFPFIKKVRQKAAKLLNLKKGDRIIDAGCGSGGSFPYLINMIGHTGEIIGIEISPQTIKNTNKRITKNNWQNIYVIEADAKTVKLSGSFNGLLMFAAPDVYASEQALSNIFPHLAVNSKVVLFGAKISKKRFGWILNGALRLVFSIFSSSTPSLNSEPWHILENRLLNFQVEEYFFGWMFIAHGSVAK